MPSTYPSSTPATISTKFGTIPDFYNDFGCHCDGSTDDTTGANNAITGVTGTGKPAYIYVPSGMNLAINYLLVPAGAALTVCGQGPGSKITFIGTPAGNGRIILPPGAANVRFQDISIEGGGTTPTHIDYASSPDPVNSFYNAATSSNVVLPLGSSFWIQGGSSGGIQTNNIDLFRVNINHTLGYAVFLDATASSGSMSGIRIRECKITNSRSTLFGASGDFSYGGYTGGIFGASTGSAANISDLLVQLCQFYCVTGHCFWTHDPALTLLNENLRFLDNYAQDVGLDMCLMQAVNNFKVQGNHALRVGYVSTSDGAVGTPKWINLGGHDIPAVMCDHGGLATNGLIAGNVGDAIHGVGCDGDGLASSQVGGNNWTSPFNSSDPNAQVSGCGPAANGQNWCVGFNSNNSNGNAGGSQVATKGNTYNGMGGGSENWYGSRNFQSSGHTVYVPSAPQAAPFTFANIGSGSVQRVTGGVLDGCTVFNNGATVPFAIELPNGTAFLNSQVVIVKPNNVLIGAGLGKFQKDPNSGSSSDSHVLSSVTPGAAVGLTSTRQVEGTSGYQDKIYKYGGALQRVYIDDGTGKPVVLFGPGASGGLTYTVTGTSWSGGFLTITIGAHSVLAGAYVGLSGVTPSGANFPLAAVVGITGTTITVAMTSNPGSYTSGGTLSVLSAGGVISTGNRSTASIGDLMASGFFFAEGALVFPTSPSYAMAAKQAALVGSGSTLSNIVLRLKSGGGFEYSSAISSGVITWTPLAGGSSFTPAYTTATITSSVATIDLSAGYTQQLNLTTSSTLISNPIGVTGQPVFTLVLVQDATGGRAVTFGTMYQGMTPAAFDATPNGITVIQLVVTNTGSIIRIAPIVSY